MEFITPCRFRRFCTPLLLLQKNVKKAFRIFRTEFIFKSILKAHNNFGYEPSHSSSTQISRLNKNRSVMLGLNQSFNTLNSNSFQSLVNQNHMDGVRKNSLSVNRLELIKGKSSSATTSLSYGSSLSILQYSLRK